MGKTVEQIADDALFAVTNVHPLRKIADERGRILLMWIKGKDSFAMGLKPFDSTFNSSQDDGFP